MADDAGALLVRSGLVSAGALDDARARVEQSGGTIGEQLVAGGVVADEALTDFYRQRLLVPLVNPNALARLPAKVVATIPGDMAIELRAVPVSLDADNNLTVAMSDPSDRHAVDEIAFFTGAYVVRAVATQMQIAWCLAHYYGHVTPLGARLMQGTPGAAAAPAAVSAPKPRTRGHTAKVNAARHRVLAPITKQVDVQRPKGQGLDDPTPGAPSSSGVPLPPPDVGPRARTASGEIRIPRAPSIRPPLPDDASGPVITIEVADEEATGPRLIAPPKRRTPARTDPPELAARAGEVDIASVPIRRFDLDSPSIVIADDAETPTTVIARPAELSAPVIIHSTVDRESQPILLEPKRPSEPPEISVSGGDDALDEDETDVIELDAPKGKRRVRAEKRTQMGMGAITAVTARAHRDTEADGFPAMIDDVPTQQMPAAGAPTAVVARPAATLVDDGPTRVDGIAAPPGADADDEVAPPPPPARITAVGAALAPTPRPVPARQIDHDDVDDGWGPPDTTIPPEVLGAMPGADEPVQAGTLPIANVDSAPLVVAPPAPPTDTDTSGSGLVRELEDATARAIELIRRLEQARERDEVVGIMVEHLASTHRRAGFFAVRPIAPTAGASLTGVARGATELALFSMTPSPASVPSATLRLDHPSTLQDVVGTRLPYRGPMQDDDSRAFLASLLGACPPEILLVPVAIRERVVGVLFGEHRVRHTFDDQLALAARAAGMSLERILTKKKP